MILVWTLAWKCYSSWLAAKNNSKKWFVALIILNTAGILDIIYVFWVAKKSMKDFRSEINSINK